MASKLQGSALCRVVLPCTVIQPHPADSARRHSSTVNLKLLCILILIETGREVRALAWPIMSATSSGFLIKAAPYPSASAHLWGQPQFRSIPSANGATSSVAAAKSTGFVAANCTTRGRSPVARRTDSVSVVGMCVCMCVCVCV